MQITVQNDPPANDDEPSTSGVEKISAPVQPTHVVVDEATEEFVDKVGTADNIVGEELKEPADKADNTDKVADEPDEGGNTDENVDSQTKDNSDEKVENTTVDDLQTGDAAQIEERRRSFLDISPILIPDEDIEPKHRKEPATGKRSAKKQKKKFVTHNEG